MAGEHEVWLHIRTIMGCAILTLEDRTAGRRAEVSYPIGEWSEMVRRQQQAVALMDEALGWPLRSRWG
jgi:hypothetical protein